MLSLPAFIITGSGGQLKDREVRRDRRARDGNAATAKASAGYNMSPRRAVCFYFTLLSIIVVSFACTAVQNEPLTWVFTYIWSDRRFFARIRALLLLCIASIGSEDGLPQIVHRKLPLLALMLSSLGCFDINFLDSRCSRDGSAPPHQAFRLGRVPPLGGTIHEYMRRQVDSRDEGGPLFLRTCIFLPAAPPLWLSSVLLAPSSVPCFAAEKWCNL